MGEQLTTEVTAAIGESFHELGLRQKEQERSHRRRRFVIFSLVAVFSLAVIFTLLLRSGNVWLRQYSATSSSARVYRGPDPNLLYVVVGEDGVTIDLINHKVSRPDTPETTPFFVVFFEDEARGAPSGSEGFPERYSVKVANRHLAILYTPHAAPISIRLE
jgi:hypothetical protein